MEGRHRALGSAKKYVGDCPDFRSTKMGLSPLEVQQLDFCKFDNECPLSLWERARVRAFWQEPAILFVRLHQALTPGLDC